MIWDLDIGHLHTAIDGWWAGRRVHEANGVDLAKTIERLRVGARNATDRWQFARLVREALVELGDAHLRLGVDWPVPDPPVASGLQLVDTVQGLAIAAPHADSPAAPADLVVAVDDEPIDHYLASVRRMPGSTPAQRRWHAAVSLMWQHLLPDDLSPPASVTLARNGTTFDVPLVWRPAPMDTPTPRCVTSRRLEPDLGLLTVHSFGCRDELGGVSDVEFRRQLDAASAVLIGVPDLVIDLRSNTGGRDQQARMLAESCISEPTTWMRFRHHGPEDHRYPDAERSIETEVLQPVSIAPFASSRLWIAIGVATMSTAEIFAAAMGAAASNRLIGERTGGSAGNPVRFRLPVSGLGIDIPVSEYFTPAGEPIEGIGLTPHHAVHTSLADVGKSRDAVVEALRATILG
jgi:hypothetical protein